MKVSAAPHEQRKVLVIVNGYPRSGKDTFVGFAIDHFTTLGWRASAVSTIDQVKKITRDLGIIDEPKTPEKRALWADIKAAFERYDRFLTRRLLCEHMKFMRTMQDATARAQILFIHVREPDAIEFIGSIREEFEFQTAFVDRPDAERVTSNASDINVEDFPYSWTISNTGSLHQLQAAARDFADKIHAGI